MVNSLVHARAAAVTGCSALAFAVSPVRAADLLGPNSLLISTTNYENVGPVAGLVANETPIPGGTAVSDGNVNTVWNNASVDGSFGVTSPITLQDLNPTTAQLLASKTLDTNQIVTSFSSKSELGLNITNTPAGPVATFMGYAPAGAGFPPTASGKLNVSNSDNSAFMDSTNPVTQFHGPSYAFNRSVVALSGNGTSITQTLAYGGNNGRGAVLAPNGLYYTVGNSNNGSGTPTELTTSTGLSVTMPGATPNSTMIDPTFSTSPDDKPGKASNFRGITLFDGNLYFTKGSGSNGINTVYTVSNPGGQLPAAATADAAKISILNGFPTTPARTSPDYTPFGLFFANPTTLYVADEGSGDSVDLANHSGLEKWTLSGDTWHLDYTLQSNLIGRTYHVPGWDFEETTVGLRNLAGRLNADGTVTLWGTTSTTSGSGDNGADPNEIVVITDSLAATSLPGSEHFSVFDSPKVGLRYGGVGYVTGASAGVPEPSTWAMTALGLGALGILGYGRGRKQPASRA